MALVDMGARCTFGVAVGRLVLAVGRLKVGQR